MEKIRYYIEKYKMIIILSLLGLILMSSLLYAVIRPNKKEKINQVEIKVKEVEVEKTIEDKIKVDIKGYIEVPGVYEMDNDSRIIDVINKAGGLKEGANTEYINLSKRVNDEMIIIIYSNNEVEKYKETEKEIVYIEYECVCLDNKNDACINEEDTVNTNGVKTEKIEETSSEKKDELISINTGTLDELMKLSGIGESKAQSIIEYREKNGKFEKLEDIMNVSGIGESAYSKIKDYIKL